MRDIELKLLLPESHPVLKTSGGGDASLDHVLQGITTGFTTGPHSLFSNTPMTNSRSPGGHRQAPMPSSTFYQHY